MPDIRFVRAKREQKRTAQDHICRLGQHRTTRNNLAVRYEKGRGLCGPCVVKQTQRHPGDSVDVASYWSRDWPATMIGPVGKRRTWAAHPKGGHDARGRD